MRPWTGPRPPLFVQALSAGPLRRLLVNLQNLGRNSTEVKGLSGLFAALTIWNGGYYLRQGSVTPVQEEIRAPRLRRSTADSLCRDIYYYEPSLLCYPDEQ